ncbi:hypothetical protein [Flavivirga jejuensis]|uniref:Exostosin GT47 domain-containing protein n=1 Tax=Flavivirga jejuensis TaxID=870487 RepID=A0ABT8WU80_9FLAO|nr:hypothetical protein [Flavivirga jejuensis]MDO5976649.1 hypothetical protein [Flavivirga jejuensis]
MLKIYTDTNLLTEQNRKLVFPLLFDLFYGNNEYLSTYYKIVNDINNSDVIVLPLEYVYSLKFYKSTIDNILDKAKQLDKPIWVYSGGDFGYTLQDKSIFNFRLGGFKSKLNERTIIIPSFINDPYQINLEKDFSPLQKNKIPEIGFVGHAKTGVLKYLKEFLAFIKINLKRILKKELKDYQPFYPSSIKRAKYLKTLKKSDKLKTNFILRDTYRAGVKTEIEKQKTTETFYQNIVKNPYTFCIRGAGNFSVRFYETLAVGRIPVLINTDCQLPLSNKIDWKKHCLIIDDEQTKTLEQQILNFHKKINEENFIKLQENNRLLWNKYLRREFFFKHIHDVFISKLQDDGLS